VILSSSKILQISVNLWCLADGENLILEYKISTQVKILPTSKIFSPVTVGRSPLSSSSTQMNTKRKEHKKAPQFLLPVQEYKKDTSTDKIPEPCPPLLSKQEMALVTNVCEYEELAKHKLPKMVYDFYAVDAEDQWTLRENSEAFSRIL
jgi:hypothetical protein